MAQKTNFNISPYFDDYDSGKNFHKVLFTPGKSIQTRELNTIQSILQNQIESFGSHVFKEGTPVAGGEISYDPSYNAIKLNNVSFGVDISLYIEKYEGKQIKGQVSGITAKVQKVVLTNTSGVDYITLYVKYLESGEEFNGGVFIDGESLLSTEAITYGINNTVIASGSPFASLIAEESTDIGTAVSITEGIYYIRGNFVRVDKDTLILDYYTTNSSYRVGLSVNEEIISAKQDNTLFDNAKGFTNFAAPGADRFKISTKLSKKSLNDFNDTNFVELLRVQNGILKQIQTNTEYNKVRDYIAKRTFDESGNYTVNPFSLSLNNSLNNLKGNNGKYFFGELTAKGNTPSDDLMCVTLGPGKAYVNGYDINKPTTTVLDVQKPRETEKVTGSQVPFTLGNVLRLNNVYGGVTNKNVVSFYNGRRSGSSPTGGKVGEARAYLCKLTDASYTGASSNWDLYLYDPTFFTELTINESVNSAEVTAGTRIEGSSSGAVGYSVASGIGTVVTVRMQSGKFLQNESISVGISTISRSITDVLSFNQNDIKSVFDETVTPVFAADTYLDKSLANGFSSDDTIYIDTNFNLKANKPLTGITTSTVVRFLEPNQTTEKFARVDSINADGLSGRLEAVSAVSGVTLTSAPGSNIQVPFIVGTSKIRRPNSAYLFSILSNNNVSSVELSNSRLSFSAQAIISQSVTQNGTLELGVAAFDIYSDTTNVSFDTSKDIEKFSIHYSNGTIEALKDDQIEYSNNNKTIKFNNICKGGSKTVYLVNASFVKTGIQSKTKVHKKSEQLDISLSSNQQSGSSEGSSLNDGLTFNRYYGLRVQDKEICLRYPDVSRILAVYESIDSNAPTLDSITFSPLYSVSTTVLVGEDVYGLDSQSIARVVEVNSNTVKIVYYGNKQFNNGEQVTFTQTNLTAPIQSFSAGLYKDITKSFILDNGQRDQYYDFSRLKRIKGQAEPTKKLKVIFDYYDVSGSNVGELYSVLSYPNDSYQKDIPRIGSLSVRATDTLDFRPRVSYFSGNSSSPFDFSSRTSSFGSSPDVIFTPDESSIINYNHYLGRVDKVYLDPNGEFSIEKGISSKEPKGPKIKEDNLHIANVSMPPYLYDIGDIRIDMIDNRRYTMRDIGKIEDRVETLERVTSLSLLESSAKSLQIQDGDGLERFKTGFFADSFKNSSLLDTLSSLSTIENDELIPLQSNRSIENTPITKNSISEVNYDTTVDYELLDNNVKKTGNVVTLNYDEVDWIEQKLATRVENVNPFHVIQYVGDIRLFPFRDIWIRTEQLENKVLTQQLTLALETQSQTERLILNNQDVTTGTGSAGLGEGGIRDTWTSLTLTDGTESEPTTSVSSDTSLSSTNEVSFVEQIRDEYMRSRNTEFSSSNLKAFTEYYASLDGDSGIKIIPKLIEISKNTTLTEPGSTNSFQVGEIISVESNGKIIMNCRLANANHKGGQYNNPNLTYTVNPYNRSEQAQELYSSQSPYLNIDTHSLAEKSAEADVSDKTTFVGYIEKGAKIFGNTSNAVAYVKNIRLITDNFGDLIGCFFVDNPNNSGQIKRFATGEKTFKLSNTANASNSLVNGSTDYSSAETTYVSEGSVNKLQNIERIVESGASLTTTNNVRIKQLNAIRNENISTTEIPTPIINNITQIIQRQRHADPLAQTFLVGTARGLNSGWTDDMNGAFLTAVDLFFKKVDSGSAALTVQIRTCEFGIPTLTMIGDPVTLRPSQIKVSNDASVATKVTFPYPIYLPPNLEYAIVLMSPESQEYEVWTAKMSEKTIGTTSLPDIESVRYTRQFAIGSLFKSQNGSTWTPDQNQDLKFKLYKASFTSTEGKLYLGNNKTKRRQLGPNPITTLPKKLKVVLSAAITDSGDIAKLVSGRKVTDNASVSFGAHGFISATGGPVNTVGLQTPGSNYKPDTYANIPTTAITGNGSGLELGFIVSSNGQIPSSITINVSGNGYAVGDVVEVDTSSMGFSGSGARITITSTNNQIDTLYLDNVIGSLSQNNLPKYYEGSTPTALSNSSITISSISQLGDYNNGNYFRVNHFSHGMYATNNFVQISNVSPDTPKIRLTSSLNATETSLNVLNSQISYFTQFEGNDVSANNGGYIKINDEIVRYTSAPTNGTSIGGPLQRGQLGTVASSHPEGSFIQKYEISGVSLARINTKHNIEDVGIDLDSYYIRFERSGTGLDSETLGIDRSSNNSTYGPSLNFNAENSVGGNDTKATENYVYDRIQCICDAIIPSVGTNIRGRVRTISGTSCDGSEVSFTDLGYEEINLNTVKKMSSLRLVASSINESEYLSSIARNKSVTTELSLSTNNYNVSPMIFLDDSKTILFSSRLNNPVSNYITNSDISTLLYDPHEATYVSKLIKLSQPSNSLKVIIAAYRHESSDFRVLYQLLKEGSNQGENVFELFPGYDNLTTDLNGDGYYDIIDSNNNSGRPDSFVPSSLDNQFIDYEFTAPNIGPYIGYKIKIVMSGTRMDKYPKFKDLRIISLA